ncbi:hypothetical protein BDF20DRAFT_915097 [Mycotypha africana]|uniref:uncharacterized protein n=1 Tax=Mycotypha africana TaxID=64632 RepID=UPI0023006B64|nr:uncharacterized protein BDF20DRAFT_915097 [Mycotypha africana]KAI8973687.1 hypothetical protein BDF20DRAFT_915097 [Mycotypha africana]
MDDYRRKLRSSTSKLLGISTVSGTKSLKKVSTKRKNKQKTITNDPLSNNATLKKGFHKGKRNKNAFTNTSVKHDTDEQSANTIPAKATATSDQNHKKYKSASATHSTKEIPTEEISQTPETRKKNILITPLKSKRSKTKKHKLARIMNKSKDLASHIIRKGTIEPNGRYTPGHEEPSVKLVVKEESLRRFNANRIKESVSKGDMGETKASAAQDSSPSFQALTFHAEIILSSDTNDCSQSHIRPTVCDKPSVPVHQHFDTSSSISSPVSEQDAESHGDFVPCQRSESIPEYVLQVESSNESVSSHDKAYRRGDIELMRRIIQEIRESHVGAATASNSSIKATSDTKLVLGRKSREFCHETVADSENGDKNNAPSITNDLSLSVYENEVRYPDY